MQGQYWREKKQQEHERCMPPPQWMIAARSLLPKQMQDVHDFMCTGVMPNPYPVRTQLMPSAVTNPSPSPCQPNMDFAFCQPNVNFLLLKPNVYFVFYHEFYSLPARCRFYSLPTPYTDLVFLCQVDVVQPNMDFSSANQMWACCYKPKLLVFFSLTKRGLLSSAYQMLTLSHTNQMWIRSVPKNRLHLCLPWTAPEILRLLLQVLCTQAYTLCGKSQMYRTCIGHAALRVHCMSTACPL